jgi:hypothetical protein
MRFIVVLLLLLIGACDGYTRENLYATHAEARSAGEVRDNGPVPTFLPSSIANIRARYNIESNELWLSFDWNGVDLGAVASRCKRALLSADQFPRRAPAKWPSDLKRGSDKAPAGTIMMTCGEGYLALQSESKRGFYWMNAS